MSWSESLNEKLTSLANAEFDYTETNDIQQAANIGLDNSGIYMEATVVYFEIKNRITQSIKYIIRSIHTSIRRASFNYRIIYSNTIKAVTVTTISFITIRT